MRPDRLLVTSFALAMALFVSLGTWQLWRAGQRAESFDRFAHAGELAALSAPVDADRFEANRYRHLELRGRYVASRQILLDSMTHEGRAGYHVLTPLRLAADEPRVLVNRGWVPADPERRRLPEIDVGEDTRMVRGKIDALPRPGLIFEDRGAAEDWPAVVLFPTIEALEARLGFPLRPYQLLLAPDAGDGYVRIWQPRAMRPERHVGYAIQWYSFAAVLGAIGLATFRRARRQAGAGGVRRSAPPNRSG